MKFFKKKVEPPKPLAEMERKYYLRNATHKPFPEWTWSEAVSAKDAIDAVRKVWNSSKGWTRMNYEIVWCANTSETLYVSTWYPTDKDFKKYSEFTMMWDKPSEPPIETFPKPTVAVSQ